MDNLAGRFDGMVQQRVCYAGHADAPAMEAGLHEFFCKWTNGLALLRGQLTDLAAVLHSAAATYDEAEQSIVDAAQCRM
jgi:hypothetical protein